ncbi:hypothetical protein YC2023_098215 [Brassica napus]
MNQFLTKPSTNILQNNISDTADSTRFRLEGSSMSTIVHLSKCSRKTSFISFSNAIGAFVDPK